MNYIKDFTISFFAGVTGALVIVFSIGANGLPEQPWFLIWFVILYCLGLLCLHILTKCEII